MIYVLVYLAGVVATALISVYAVHRQPAYMPRHPFATAFFIAAFWPIAWVLVALSICSDALDAYWSNR